MAFSLILFLLTVFTGALWCLDVFVLAPKRRALAEDELKAFDQNNEEALRSGVQSVVAARSAIAAQATERPKWLEYTAGFFPVICFIFLLRSFLVEPFRIPSGSMMPTLEKGDMILVNKYEYGLRLPVINTKVIPVGSPKRGDTVVFHYPADPSIDYIKRIVGLPGDTISYINKELLINGKPVQKTADGKFLDEEKLRELEQYIEKLGDKSHKIIVDPKSRARAFAIPAHNDPSACDYVSGGVVCKVPQDMYFVLGDNRDNSEDSRYWGFVPDKYLVGRAFMIWLNLSKPSRIGFFE